MSRNGQLERNTKETQIKLALDLDTPGNVVIESPLPFLNHMMNTFACHGQFSLTYQAQGDVDVDPHHLVEDTGIALGQVLIKALNDSYSGIQRAGCFSYPMDATLANVAIDLCGRSNLAWHVPAFESATVGDLDPRLFREFYKGFVDGARATLNIHVPFRDNDHHVVEASFKAFTRALHFATRPLGSSAVMSTKGVLEI